MKERESWDCKVQRGDLTSELHQAFGNDYSVAEATNMHGGAQKVVYRVRASNGFTLMLCIWDITNNYFQAEIEEAAATEGNEEQRSFDVELFLSNNRFMREHGIRTPAIYAMNRSREQYPFDYALVEYVGGGDLQPYMEHPSTAVRDKVFGGCRDLLGKLHQIRHTSWGQLTLAGKPGGHRPANCEDGIHDNASRNLVFLSQEAKLSQEQQGKLDELLAKVCSSIVPRTDYRFIHNELGPDHILLNEQLEPYLIDIEGAGFFDLEYEHSFLQFRFANYERYLARTDLDEVRMRFYKLCHHISCTAGGLKLLQRGFPNRTLAHDIMSSNLSQTLSYL
ncbi:phosphotransferase family protein [Paenibacillus sp. OV219]|uniref:phosphotransferase family protein n=1 Tax=Paenibacillus sp. OV219 TaxID=1884377 RepID=UPI0008C1AD26|nr:phosphotransferase [Paenibacillus sp. OV219]SEN84203.1 Phosphotransferase enzyme family protein [Paenibacillus sp. OV219]